MRLTYVVNARLPTEKAHGLQIVENCAAFAHEGAEVTLVVPRRWRSGGSADAIRAHYRVPSSFEIVRLPCLDLLWLPVAKRATFVVQLATFSLMVRAWALARDTDVVYSRDPLALLLLGAGRRGAATVFEAHRLAESRAARALERLVLRRAGLVVTVTSQLAADLRQRGAWRVLIEPDGFSPGRFANLPPRESAKQALGLPQHALVVGYVGRMRTLGEGKGLETVVDACALARDLPLHLLLVGGPDEDVSALEQRWRTRGLPTDRWHAVGQVAPVEVPALLAAIDVGVVPFPAHDVFARYASPLKLFEYFAAGATVVASDLPAIREVVVDGDNGLLVPAGDATALARALRRLNDEPGTARRLAARARDLAAHHSWHARAKRVLRALTAGPPEAEPVSAP